MDNQLEIQLNSTRNVDAVNVDTFSKIELLNEIDEIMEYDIRNVISASNVFEIERQETEVYRIYGKINYLSLLNNLVVDYQTLPDYFNQDIEFDKTYKTLLNSFKFYLVKPSTTFNSIGGGRYVRNFDVIATSNNFDIYKAGFSKNIYNEQEFAFNFDIDFDISTYRDFFNFPLTELFLYVEYIPSGTTIDGILELETMQYISGWDSGGQPIISSFVPTPLSVGDIIVGDLITYTPRTFFQGVDTNQTYYIKTPFLSETSNVEYLQWKYNPFIPFRLRYFESEVNFVNKGTTSNEQLLSIPDYATDLGGGNMVWKDIQPQGYIDPLTNLGVDYPFINNKRYLYSNIILDVIPDLGNATTLDVFTNINFGEDATIVNSLPSSDLNNIGNPCL